MGLVTFFGNVNPLRLAISTKATLEYLEHCLDPIFKPTGFFLFLPIDLLKVIDRLFKEVLPTLLAF